MIHLALPHLGAHFQTFTAMVVLEEILNKGKLAVGDVGDDDAGDVGQENWGLMERVRTL